MIDAMRATRPLFQVDPGWLFIMAGLSVCAAGILLPAQADLESLHRQLEVLRQEEAQAYARLEAHAQFIDQVDQADPALVKRLAAAQLNMVPDGDTPVLLAVRDGAPVTDWIDATVQADIRPPAPAPISALSKLANGPHRLWMFGGGIMAVFVGLMLSPSPVRFMRRRRALAIVAEDDCREEDHHDDRFAHDDDDDDDTMLDDEGVACSLTADTVDLDDVALLAPCEDQGLLFSSGDVAVAASAQHAPVSIQPAGVNDDEADAEAEVVDDVALDDLERDEDLEHADDEDSAEIPDDASPEIVAEAADDDGDEDDEGEGEEDCFDDDDGEDADDDDDGPPFVASRMNQ